MRENESIAGDDVWEARGRGKPGESQTAGKSYTWQRAWATTDIGICEIELDAGTTGSGKTAGKMVLDRPYSVT